MTSWQMRLEINAASSRSVGGTRWYQHTAVGIAGSDAATFVLEPGSSTFSRADTGASVGVRMGALEGSGNIVGSSYASTATYYIGGKNLDCTFSGGIYQGGIDTTAQTNTAIVKTGTGTLTLDGGVFTNITSPDGLSYETNLVATNNFMNYVGSTTVSNGVLKLVVPIVLTNTINGYGPTPIALASPTAVLDVVSMGYTVSEIDNSVDPAVVTNIIRYTNSVIEIAPNQSLSGIGTIRGNVLADQGSTLNPGNVLGVVTNGFGTGLLTVTTNVTIAGRINMRINATNVPTADKLVAGGNITISPSATLTVTNVGPGLINNTKYVLFSQAVSGFAVTNLPATDPTGTTNYQWRDDLAVDGSITLTNGGIIPAPPVLTNSFNAASGELTLSWGEAYKGLYRLLAQTNTASTGLSNNWVEWTGASSTNKVVISIDATKDTVFFRLVYP